MVTEKQWKLNNIIYMLKMCVYECLSGKKEKRQTKTYDRQIRTDIILQEYGVIFPGIESRHCSENFISFGLEQDLAFVLQTKGAEGKKPRKTENGMYGTDKTHKKGRWGHFTKSGKVAMSQPKTLQPLCKIVSYSMYYGMNLTTEAAL